MDDQVSILEVRVQNSIVSAVMALLFPELERLLDVKFTDRQETLEAESIISE